MGPGFALEEKSGVGTQAEGVLGLSLLIALQEGGGRYEERALNIFFSRVLNLVL